MITMTGISTPLGRMIAGATEKGLCFMEFMDSDDPHARITKIEKAFRMKVVKGTDKPLDAAAVQLDEYFAGRRKAFDVRLDIHGTPFQEQAWKALLDIPYGSTISYKEQASMIGRPSAVRAAANANARNWIAIIIPCHRVIGADGTLTGYGGGLWRKEFLLDLEAKHTK